MKLSPISNETRQRTSLMRWLVAVAALTFVAADGINAVQRVRDGIAHFNAAEFKKAATAFEEADTAKPDDARIAFDRACATAAMEDIDSAREFYRTAGVAKDVEVSAAAHYNLGTLSVDEAKTILGPDPVTVEPSKRPDALEKLELAILHYRDCLQVDPEHDDARHNLELLRLWIKNMQALWREHDRNKARDEMDLLQFLKMLEGKEEQLRSESRVLSGFDDSPRRRQALSIVEDGQTELADEVEPLKEKIVEAVTPPADVQTSAAAPNPPPVRPPGDDQRQQLDQARDLLTGIADEVGEQMLAAAQELAVPDFDAARTSQERVVDSLQQIAMAVTPFADIVQESLRKQKSIMPVETADALGATGDLSDVPDVDADAETSSDSEETEEAEQVDVGNSEEIDAEEDELRAPVDFQESGWRQKQVVNWSSLIGPKAEMELASLQEQLGSMPDADQIDESEKAEKEDDDSDDTDDSANDAQPAKDAASLSPEAAQAQQQLEQMQQMAKAMERAIELAPDISEATMTAEQLLSDENAEGALPHQQQAADLLQEIIDLFPKQDSQQNQEEDQNEQDQDSRDEDEQDQQQPDSGDSEDEEQQDDENSDQNEQRNQQQERQQQDMSRQQAESVLRRARERERQHREQKKALERAIAVPVPVERDW